MSTGLAIVLATILLLAIIILVKVFDKEIRKSKIREQGIILMFSVMIALYVYGFIKMMGGF